MWNDSGAVAWFNTGLLFVTTLLIGSWAVQRFSGTRLGRPDDRTWHRQMIFLSMLCFVFILFTINKQLDAQTYLTKYGRRLAHEGGWYKDRRKYQFIAVVIAAVSSLATLGGMIWLVRQWSWPYKLACAGFLFYLLFALLRLSSFEHTDTALAFKIYGYKISRFVEPLGPALISIAAIAALRTRSRFGCPA